MLWFSFGAMCFLAIGYFFYYCLHMADKDIMHHNQATALFIYAGLMTVFHVLISLQCFYIIYRERSEFSPVVEPYWKFTGCLDSS